MPVVKENTLSSFIGGGGYKPSCVFNCFDYLDGGLYDAQHYYNKTLTNLGYEPGDSGGVRASDIGTIGSYGGFHVEEITSTFTMSSNGGINGGGRAIMTFNAGGIDHAVVVTGYEYINGELNIKYHDPTTGQNSYRTAKNSSAIYRVDPLFIDSPINASGYYPSIEPERPYYA